MTLSTDPRDAYEWTPTLGISFREWLAGGAGCGKLGQHEHELGEHVADIFRRASNPAPQKKPKGGAR